MPSREICGYESTLARFLVATSIVSVVLATSSPTYSPVAQCSTGQYMGEGRCNDCESNYYCPDGISRLSCPTGAGTNGTLASTSLSNCTCNAGFYGTNATNCTNCTTGQYCPDGQTLEICPAGYYCNPTYTLTACQEGDYCPEGTGSKNLCAAGNYCPDVYTQTACPDTVQVGYYCPEGSVIYQACDKGYYCPNSTTRIQCPDNVTCDTQGKYTIINCEIGSFCTNESSNAESYACSGFSETLYCPEGTISTTPPLCPAGYYCSTPVDKVQCASGSYCAEGTKTEAKCAAGYYCPNSTVQLSCAAGSYCPEGSTSETQCEVGSYCNTTKQQITCGPKYYCPASSTSQDFCPQGYYCTTPSKITLCSPPAYCPEGSISNDSCTAGYYCPNTTTTIQCVSGQFCEAGSTNYSICPAGFYCPLPSNKLSCSGTAGSYCPSASTTIGSCPGGYYCVNSSSSPIACNLSQYCPEGSSNWTLCEKGKYCPQTNVQLECPAGKYCNTGSNSAVDCPLGFYCPNASVRIDCPEGYYCNDGSISPSVCSAGHYCPNGSIEELCDTGDFCEAGSTARMLCPAGSYCPSTSTIFNCSSSQWCPEGSQAAATCSTGYFCPTPSERYICPEGAYCPQGTSNFTWCDAGSYCPNISSLWGTSRISCSPGFYCPYNSTTLTDCPAGYYCADPTNPISCSSSSSTVQYCPTGSSSAKTCSQGYYCPNSSVEIPCPLGEYSSDVNGALNCTQCTANYYCDSLATSSPKTCPTNSISDIGSSAVTDCRCDSAQKFEGTISDSSSVCNEIPNPVQPVFIAVLFIVLAIILGIAYWFFKSDIGKFIIKKMLKERSLVWFAVTAEATDLLFDFLLLTLIVMASNNLGGFEDPMLGICCVAVVAFLMSASFRLRTYYKLDMKIDSRKVKAESMKNAFLQYSRRKYPQNISRFKNLYRTKSREWEDIVDRLLSTKWEEKERIDRTLADNQAKSIYRLLSELRAAESSLKQLGLDGFSLIAESLPMLIIGLLIFDYAACMDLRVLILRLSILSTGIMCGAKMYKMLFVADYKGDIEMIKDQIYHLIIDSHFAIRKSRQIQLEAKKRQTEEIKDGIYVAQQVFKQILLRSSTLEEFEEAATQAWRKHKNGLDMRLDGIDGIDRDEDIEDSIRESHSRDLHHTPVVSQKASRSQSLVERESILARSLTYKTEVNSTNGSDEDRHPEDKVTGEKVITIRDSGNSEKHGQDAKTTSPSRRPRTKHTTTLRNPTRPASTRPSRSQSHAPRPTRRSASRMTSDGRTRENSVGSARNFSSSDDSSDSEPQQVTPRRAPPVQSGSQPGSRSSTPVGRNARSRHNSGARRRVHPLTEIKNRHHGD
ncbi:hypothetical protein AAMO2058_001715600 [Amorphochlora amoebiformis]